ncbi:MAG: cadherin-like domain-containing protein [Actinomycetota bacterium]
MSGLTITSFGVYSFQLREAPANGPPVAEDDAAETDHGIPVTIDVLANDSDPDGDDLTIDSVTQPANGTATIDGSQITYTPDGGFAGPDSFTYTISDGKGGSDTATVIVTVHAPANTAPAAEDDSLTTDEDMPESVDVLANDTDADGDALTLTDSTHGSHGTVACMSTGSCTYTPDADYNGPDSFTYTVSDGNGGSTTLAINNASSESFLPLASARRICLTSCPGTSLTSQPLATKC